VALVSVVMRTKDRPLLLERAVASVCAQTLGDWHLVIVNDGGAAADVDTAIAGREAELAGRVSVLRNEVPKGMSAALNQGIKASDSAHIAVHDDDDSWHPEFLARTVAHLDATADAAVAVRTEIVYECIDGTEISETGRVVFCPDVCAFSLTDMLLHNRTVPISVLYRRAVHAEIGWYREDLPVVQDWELWLRLALTEHTLGFIDGQPLAFWHQRPDATDSLANSTIGSNGMHRAMDALVRDEALRAYARVNGIGELLYLARFMRAENDRLRDVQRETNRLLRVQGQRLDRIEATISHGSLVGLARGLYRRLYRRLRTRPHGDERANRGAGPGAAVPGSA
jgi:glycosyltransferase involved in cell wall biosynthesis